MTRESGPAREQAAGRIVFAPRAPDGPEDLVWQRQLRRQRHSQFRWYLLFSIPTLALLAMAAWAFFGGSSPPPPSARAGTNVSLDATVKTVDADAATVHLTSEMLGIFGATLYLTKDTRIELAEGKDGRLADLQEGTRVRTAYDLHAGRKMATRIVVVPKDAVSEGGLETRQASPGRR